jgi:signal transduction histidine kinase
MGLSIVETIATAHGWGIGVTDGGEDGARFEIQLGVTRGSSDDLLPSG